MQPLNSEILTWTALLTQWMDFARAALSMPDDAEGECWRESVTSIINLQAVTFALADLMRLEDDDRPLARDRAAVLIREHAGRLDQIWRGRPMPDHLMEMIGDAQSALEVAAYAGAVELCWSGPGAMVMPSVPLGEPVGTLALMQPGTIVMPGEPVAWWVDRDSREIERALPRCRRRGSADDEEPRAAVPRQVYRQIDDAGRIVRDVLAPITAPAPPGLPLLVPICEGGRPIGHFTVEAEVWEAQQRAAMVGDEIAVAQFVEGD